MTNNATIETAKALTFGTELEYTNISRTHSVVAELNSSFEGGSNDLRVGYTYQQERGFDVAQDAAQNEAMGQFANVGIGLGMMSSVGGGVANMVGGAVNTAFANTSTPSGDAPRIVNSFCENCGAKLTPGALFCEDCGSKLTVNNSTCSNCGYSFERPGKFCPKCGTKREV